MILRDGIPVYVAKGDTPRAAFLGGSELSGVNPIVERYLSEHYPDDCLRVSPKSKIEPYLEMIGSGVDWASKPGIAEGQVHLMPFGHNGRDIGGWPCAGGHIAYGKIIRAIELDNGTAEDAEAIAYLHDVVGIKAELDMRMGDEREIKEKSVIPGAIYYGQKGVTQQYSINGDRVAIESITPASFGYGGVKNILTAISTCLTNNRPIYIHCVHGADRTGIFVAILMALLGCNDDAIIKEYELTSLADGFGVKGRRLCSGGFGSVFAKSIYDLYPTCTSFADGLRRWINAKVRPTESVVNNLKKHLIV